MRHVVVQMAARPLHSPGAGSRSALYFKGRSETGGDDHARSTRARLRTDAWRASWSIRSGTPLSAGRFVNHTLTCLARIGGRFALVGTVAGATP